MTSIPVNFFRTELDFENDQVTKTINLIMQTDDRNGIAAVLFELSNSRMLCTGEDVSVEHRYIVRKFMDEFGWSLILDVFLQFSPCGESEKFDTGLASWSPESLLLAGNAFFDTRLKVRHSLGHVKNLIRLIEQFDATRKTPNIYR